MAAPTQWRLYRRQWQVLSFRGRWRRATVAELETHIASTAKLYGLPKEAYEAILGQYQAGQLTYTIAQLLPPTVRRPKPRRPRLVELRDNVRESLQSQGLRYYPQQWRNRNASVDLLVLGRISKDLVVRLLRDITLQEAGKILTLEGPFREILQYKMWTGKRRPSPTAQDAMLREWEFYNEIR